MSTIWSWCVTCSSHNSSTMFLCLRSHNMVMTLFFAIADFLLSDYREWLVSCLANVFYCRYRDAYFVFSSRVVFCMLDGFKIVIVQCGIAFLMFSPTCFCMLGFHIFRCFCNLIRCARLISFLRFSAIRFLHSIISKFCFVGLLLLGLWICFLVSAFVGLLAFFIDFKFVNLCLTFEFGFSVLSIYIGLRLSSCCCCCCAFLFASMRFFWNRIVAILVDIAMPFAEFYFFNYCRAFLLAHPLASLGCYYSQRCFVFVLFKLSNWSACVFVCVSFADSWSPSICVWDI